MNRHQAYLLGLTRYPASQPCLRGHTSERYVSTGACVDCVAYYNSIPPTGKPKAQTAKEMLAKGFLPKRNAVYLGSPIYLTGKILKCGHLGEQITATDECRMCLQQQHRKQIVDLLS